MNNTRNEVKEAAPTSGDVETGVPKKNNITSNTRDESFCLACFGGVSIVLLALGVIAASITYYVYCIISLVRDSNASIQETCADSNLWVYILVVLIMNLVLAKGNSNKKEEEMNAICNLFVSIIVLSSMCTWGSVEFWRPCVQDKLSNLLIFTMVKTTLIIHYTVIGICFIIICYILRECKKKSTISINKM
ncbi:MAG: hypothetical protein CMF80_06825 [Candidatus Marinimicrobia bacterium]|nr:hypothetical protein [Candidatus Neomarinimicrobiota bacterium]|tara:strand:+ start:535 stop:1107 length:573 start_codon:yes stop_codon:yes gene_type:complete